MATLTSPRHKSVAALGADEFRIEFDDDVLPPPVSRLNTGAEASGVVEEEDFETRLQRTQEELMQLRHQARIVERRKEELEDLNRKEAEYTHGRAEMHEKLTRVLVTLERECTDTQRKLESILQARDDLARHLRALNSTVIEDWNAPGAALQSDEALAVIADARLDYERSMTRISPYLDQAAVAKAEAAPATSAHDFRYWFRAGLAFTLPLVILGCIALALSLLF